jgi:uncharacterized protein (DUF488 family)
MTHPVYTIGHSNHPTELFLQLLHTHAITAIADVRSRPHSRYNPHFDREPLTTTLKQQGIQYVFLGYELGARSNNPDCYLAGKVQYSRIALTKPFRQGLDRILTGSQTHRIALMCAEKEPLDCHRTILVSRHLADLGVAVQHIHADGHLEPHPETMARLCAQLRLRDDIHHLFRTPQDLLEDAYTLQEQRIAYETEEVSGVPIA